ncbi:hypothetical protein [Halorubrum yunnanense]|uniref:Uncharacterized protein n=1 Tax=Halorubrum yunnanense TaxID=1526162 RepID=A0ABD5YAY8_9EURY|nr:hypothetical protein [Halorubrum yunnanense]
MSSQRSRADRQYHVVCRECVVEKLFESADDAAAAKLEHAKETGHQVVVGRVK